MARHRERRGNYSVMICLMIPMIFGFAALGVDVSYMVLVNTQAQFAADAAAQAAYTKFRAHKDESLAKAAAYAILRENRVGGAPGDLTELDFGTWDGKSFKSSRRDVNAVHVGVGRSDGGAVQTLFAKFLGVQGIGVSAESTVASRKRSIMIAQDVTGSFADDIKFAVEADIGFLDFMMADNFEGDQIGLLEWQRIVPGIRTPLQDVGGNYSKIRKDWEQMAIDHSWEWQWQFRTHWCQYAGVDERCNDCPRKARDLAEIPPNNLCGAFNVLYGGKGLTKYCSYMTGGEYCYIDDFVGWQRCQKVCYYVRRGRRWRYVCETDDPPVSYPGYGNCYLGMSEDKGETLGTAPGVGISTAVEHLLEAGAKDSFKAVVLMSDGLPNYYEDYADAERAADFAWKNDIHIWTVTYRNGGGDYTFMTQLARGQGSGYLADRPEELSGLMLDVALGVPVILVE